MNKSGDLSRKKSDDIDTYFEKTVMEDDNFQPRYPEELALTRNPSNLDRDAKLSYQSYVLNKKKVNEKINSLSSSLCPGANLPRSMIDSFVIINEKNLNFNNNDDVSYKVREKEFKSNSCYSYQHSNESDPEITDIKLEAKGAVKGLVNNDEPKLKSIKTGDVKKEKKPKKLVSFNEADDLFIDSFQLTRSITTKAENKTLDNILPPEHSTNFNHESNILSEPVRIDHSFLNLLDEDITCFLLKPAPVGLTIKCQIHRQKAFFSEYKLFLESEEGALKILMTAKKSRGTANPTVILNVIDSNKNLEIPFAKLKSNMFGTQFTLYGNEQDSIKTDRTGHNSSKHAKVKTEFITMLYEVNLLGFKGPRKMICK